MNYHAAHRFGTQSQIKREKAWNQHNVEDERVWRSCPHMALSAP